MIKRLRWKFVLINMTIVTLMLCVIFSLLYSFTWVDLENKSIAMMRSIADNPAGQSRRADPPGAPALFHLAAGAGPGDHRHRGRLL